MNAERWQNFKYVKVHSFFELVDGTAVTINKKEIKIQNEILNQNEIVCSTFSDWSRNRFELNETIEVNRRYAH